MSRAPNMTNAQHITVAGSFEAATINDVAFVFWFPQSCVRIHPSPEGGPNSYLLSITHASLAEMVQMAATMLSLEKSGPDNMGKN